MPKIRNKLKFKYQSGSTPIVPATSAESLIHIGYPDPFGTSSSPFWDHVVNTNTGSNRSFEVSDAEGNKVTFFLDPNTSNHIDTTTSSNKTIGISDLNSDIKAGLQSGLDDLRAKISESINADPTLNITAQPDDTSPFNKVKLTYTPGSSGNGVKFNNITLSNLYFFFGEATGGTDQSGNDPIFSYKEKSGNLTKLPKNILKVKDSLQGSLPIEKIIDLKGYPNLKSIFDDNNIIIYDTKSVDLITKTDLTSSIETKKNNKFVSTPNVFSFNSFTKSHETRSEFYDRVLEKNNLEVQNSAYDENICFFENKDGSYKNEKEIILDISFEKECVLQNNLVDNTTPEEYALPGRSEIDHRTFKSPTAYFNFENNRWDYLGDIEQNSFDTPSNQINNQFICFSGLTIQKDYGTLNTGTKFPASIGIPIDTFSFPYDVKYHANDNHFINISDYIEDDFVLKKVSFSGEFSSRGNGDASYGNFISINNVNFFILNQRNNFNSEIVDTNDIDKLKEFKYRDTDNSGSFILTTENKNINFIDLSSDGIRFSFLTEDENGDILVNKTKISNVMVSKPSQRDIITYNTLVNYSSGSLTSNNSEGLNSYIDYEKVKKEADFFKEVTSNSNTATVDYDRETITITSNLKSPVKQDEISLYSDDRILIGNKFGTRSCLPTLTGRSNKQENYTSSSFKTNTIDYGEANDSFPVTFNVYEDINSNDQYVLKKKDKLILGVSLTNSLSHEDPGWNDKFVIHKLKVKLIGSYKKNEKIKSSHNSKFLTSNSVRKSIIGNTSVVNKYITEPIQFMKRNYITREFNSHGIGSEYVNSNDQIKKSVSRIVKLLENDKNKDIYDTAVNNVLEVIEVDNKKPLDSDWDGFDQYTDMNSEIYSGFLLNVKPDFKNEETDGSFSEPDEYENNIWASSYPFEERYRGLDRPISINYERLGIKGIIPFSQESPEKGDLTKIIYVSDNINKNFYSFNTESETRLPIDNEISGFKLGLLFPERSKRFIVFNSKKFGNFSDLINFHRNYVYITTEGDVERTVSKQFIDNDTYQVITNTDNLSNTYNRNFYSEITKPFIDKDINSLTQNNSIP